MYNIVLRETDLDDGLSKQDINKILGMISDTKVIPYEVQGEFSAASGFISLKTADEIVNYNYITNSPLYEFISDIICDTEKQNETGEYTFRCDDGDVSIRIIV